MDNGYSDPDLEYWFNLSEDDTASSSSSTDRGLFDRNEHFILELHDLQRDITGNPEKHDKPDKVKKLRKKKKEGKKEAKPKTESSSSPSEASVKPHTDLGKEEFYDAHESYHGLSPDTKLDALATPATPANPVVGAAVVMARSDHGAEPKVTPPILPAAEVTEAAKNVISKPSVD